MAMMAAHARVRYNPVIGFWQKIGIKGRINSICVEIYFKVFLGKIGFFANAPGFSTEKLFAKKSSSTISLGINEQQAKG